jgi:putative ABC transport system ATP-binding protein
MLVAKDVGVSFGSTCVLTDASLEVYESEVVSIMGPSGSGKSTFLACLAGIVVPQQGHVSFRGTDLGALSADRRGRIRLHEFGFIFQFGDLVPELTLVENVELPLRFSGLRPIEARRMALQAMDLLGVAVLAHRRTFAVSGGELQRVAVARALVHSPAVVFADEPTGALDEYNGGLVLDLLLEAAPIRNSSVVLVTHDPEVAARAGRRFVMQAGQVVQQS